MNDQFPIEGDLGKAWDNLMGRSFLIHRGFRGERIPGGRIRFKDKEYTTQEFFDCVDAIVYGGVEAIKNSINSK
jgi:hypothetical protein